MASETYKILGFVFDIIAAIVSLLDLTTDIIIMIIWYSQDRMLFFWISVAILILAQISYISIFYYNHGRINSFGDFCHTMLSILCTLPLSPFLSFIFYLVGDKDSCLRGFIDTYLICYNFSWNNNYIDPNSSPQQKYLEEKLYKHLGFILEALIEAFPQSILQLTAIVYYNEPNTISVLSILISMSSVCSKIFLLTLTGDTRGWTMKILTWMCFVCDFFGSFFIVSFAFHTPTNPDLQIYFLIIRNIYFYEFLIAVVPFAIIGSIGLHLYWTIEATSDRPECVCCVFFGVTILWVIGLFMTLLAMEIFCIWWFGIVIISLAYTQRVPYEKSTKKFYIDHMRWIIWESNDIMDVDNNGTIMITKQRDKVLRLCVFNKIMLEHHPDCKLSNFAKKWNWWKNIYNENFLKYLQNEEKTQFKNVTLKKLRLNAMNPNYSYPSSTHDVERIPNPLKAYFYEFYAALFRDFAHGSCSCNKFIATVTLFWLTFITGPIYIISRFFNLLMPILIALYLYINGNGIVLWRDINTFQVIMWIVYVLLLCIWFILLYIVIKDEYILWHILPNTTRLKACDHPKERDKVSKRIKDYYLQITIYPVIEKIINDKFGIDISYVIMEYFMAIHTENQMV